ncbi:unnamed protein product [Dibothriocephalus latus]|uniref:Uncharacterized protein n=1 Tax=Dibothriocephalus latus TaxID=60516 RepID=A0A3P6T6C1_DIBLA|nr:unnamed protein product [Dibothriocephalus latus]
MMRSEHMHLATRVASLVGVCLMMFTLGYIGSQGNISPYIISYLHKYVDPSIHNSHAVWIAAASLSSQGVLMPLSGLLIHKLGFRLILFVSFLLFSTPSLRVLPEPSLQKPRDEVVHGDSTFSATASELRPTSGHLAIQASFVLQMRVS